MPPPAALVITGIVAAGALGYAFKEFVWEPYLGPKFEQWAEDFVRHRREARLRRSAHLHESSSSRRDDDDDEEDGDQGDLLGGAAAPSRASTDFARSVAPETSEWRDASGLRQRNPTIQSGGSGSRLGGSFGDVEMLQLEQNNNLITFPPGPTTSSRVLFDSESSTPSQGDMFARSGFADTHSATNPTQSTPPPISPSNSYLHIDRKSPGAAGTARSVTLTASPFITPASTQPSSPSPLHAPVPMFAARSPSLPDHERVLSPLSESHWSEVGGPARAPFSPRESASSVAESDVESSLPSDIEDGISVSGSWLSVDSDAEEGSARSHTSR
ncbi:hypothetical protein BOTBODRAFT_31853 [Botryobasidium botryosum FD-172 SS1]|uniref:Uncharacterized protein n=1 Tax=Botryobasidium botryosum (strain FD-172 SS1) TaxID=930990 RepID=A0A067MJ09_BOTB1|nr:hypothetical protein BOTBODRAFT_31853 [Botryobasidium botryosum FD-172 SS1]